MMTKPILRVLLTGVGSPAAPGVMQSLRMSKEYVFDITGVDCSPDAAGFHMTDRYYIGPRASEKRFIPYILELCRKEKIDILFSLVTDELIKLSENQAALLGAGTRLVISPPDALRTVIDKACLYETLQQMGIAVPEFRTVEKPEQLMNAIYDLGFPSRPVCFKPVKSDGSRGFHILDAGVDPAELLFRHKPNSAYVTEQELQRIVSGQPDIPKLLVMEYLPYEEYSVDVLVDRGRVHIAVPRLREATTMGISTKSVIRQEQDIIDYAVTAVERLQLNGNIGVQVRRDASRRPKLVEINPRIQGTIVHCTAAGINLPLLAVKQVLGIAPAKEELDIKWGTRMIRYWKEVYVDANGSSYAL